MENTYWINCSTVYNPGNLQSGSIECNNGNTLWLRYYEKENYLKH